MTPMKPTTDPAPGSPVRAWGLLCRLHGQVQTRIDRELRSAHHLSAREYLVLDVLSGQHDGAGGHLKMRQVEHAVALSPSATTRLVTRIEDRGLLRRYLCPTDRRGIYTDVTEQGYSLLAAARPTYHAALRSAYDEAATHPELAPLVEAVRSLPATGASPTVQVHISGCDDC